MVAALRYTPNGNFTAPTPWALGFNLADCSASQLSSLPSGVKGLVFVDGKSGLTAGVQAEIDACVGNANLYGFYIADEPDPAIVPAANLKAVSDYCHTHTGKPTFIVLEDSNWEASPDYSPSQIYHQSITGIDYFGIDSYPVRSDLPGNFDISTISLHVNNAISNGFTLATLVPIIQVFGGLSPWILPTAAQVTQMWAAWDTLIPTPPFEYAYEWGLNFGIPTALSNSPQLWPVFQTRYGVGGSTTQTLLPSLVNVPDTIYAVGQQTQAQGPFFFALVDPSVSFDASTMLRQDLQVVDFNLQHDEGQKPILQMTVRNPQVGLLTAGRKRDLWMSWLNKKTLQIEPLFYGRLVAIPTNIIGMKVSLTFIADPPDYLTQKQAIAEGLKIRPFYDPVFLDLAHRDDPDSILEGYTYEWHVDRVTHLVSASDFVLGEDGTVIFHQEDVLFASVTMETATNPLTVVEVEAQVQWTQAATGIIDLGTRYHQVFGGDAFMSQWPNPLASLGGGWSVADSHVTDSWGIQNAATQTYTWSWQNKEKEHNDGDTMSVNISWTTPVTGGAGVARGVTVTTSFTQQDGFVDPFAVDADGDPAPVNIPSHAEMSTSTALSWNVVGSMTLQYDANRARTEHLRFTLASNLQEVVTALDVSTNTEIITIQGADVGQPLLDANIWEPSTLYGRGTVVRIPTSLVPLILRENFQIAVIGGTSGATEPTFPQELGFKTVDNTVTWASLGTNPATNLNDWVAGQSTALGALIQPKIRLWTAYSQLVAIFPVPVTGVSVAVGRIVRRNNGASFQECTTGGTTGTTEPAFSDTRGVTTNDGTAVWTCLGTSILDGTTIWMSQSSNGSVTGTLLPEFTGSAGTTIVDGGVTWLSLGTAAHFAGIPIVDVSRRSYFPTDRGLWSVEYCLCVARAHLLHRARLVKVSWNCPAELIPVLSCRKNAIIQDPRIPNGYAFGKITSYSITAKAGSILGKVQIECMVGTNAAISTGSGSPGYCDDSYVVDGYFEKDGVVIAINSLADVGYTPPIDVANDDGLIFPLTAAEVVVADHVVGSVSNTLIAQALHADGDPPAAITAWAPQTQKVGGNLSKYLQSNPVYWELILKPVAGQTFEDEFVVETTDLNTLMGINFGS